MPEFRVGDVVTIRNPGSQCRYGCTYDREFVAGVVVEMLEEDMVKTCLIRLNKYGKHKYTAEYGWKSHPTELVLASDEALPPQAIAALPGPGMRSETAEATQARMQACEQVVMLAKAGRSMAAAAEPDDGPTDESETEPKPADHALAIREYRPAPDIVFYGVVGEGLATPAAYTRLAAVSDTGLAARRADGTWTLVDRKAAPSGETLRHEAPGCVVELAPDTGTLKFTFAPERGVPLRTTEVAAESYVGRVGRVALSLAVAKPNKAGQQLVVAHTGNSPDEPPVPMTDLLSGKQIRMVQSATPTAKTAGMWTRQVDGAMLCAPNGAVVAERGDVVLVSAENMDGVRQILPVVGGKPRPGSAMEQQDGEYSVTSNGDGDHFVRLDGRPVAALHAERESEAGDIARTLTFV